MLYTIYEEDSGAGKDLLDVNVEYTAQGGGHFSADYCIDPKHIDVLKGKIGLDLEKWDKINTDKEVWKLEEWDIQKIKEVMGYLVFFGEEVVSKIGIPSAIVNNGDNEMAGVLSIMQRVFVGSRRMRCISVNAEVNEFFKVYECFSLSTCIVEWEKLGSQAFIDITDMCDFADWVYLNLWKQMKEHVISRKEYAKTVELLNTLGVFTVNQAYRVPQKHCIEGLIGMIDPEILYETRYKGVEFSVSGRFLMDCLKKDGISE